MTEGTLVEWLVADGDTVAAGTPLYLLETEKVENEIESPVAGTIRLVRTAGESYAVGTTVARGEERRGRHDPRSIRQKRCRGRQRSRPPGRARATAGGGGLGR